MKGGGGGNDSAGLNESPTLIKVSELSVVHQIPTLLIRSTNQKNKEITCCGQAKMVLPLSLTMEKGGRCGVS